MPADRRYEIRRPADAALLARGLTVWAWLDRKTGRVGRIPEQVAEAFSVAAGGAGTACG